LPDNSIKLLVIDIDGTLLNKKGEVAPADIDAITVASRKGIQIALSTGRVVQASLHVIEKLGLDGYHVFFDGALASNPHTGHEVFVEPIASELVEQMIAYNKAHNTVTDFYSVSDFFVEEETWASEIRRKFFHLKPIVTDYGSLHKRERIIKATLVVRTEEEKASAREFVKYFEDVLHFSWTTTPAYPGIDFINILNPKVSKGRALEALSNFLDIPLSSIAAIGNGSNDISLLQKAGYAVAMGNSPDDLVAVADYVTLDVEQCGVAHVINTVLL